MEDIFTLRQRLAIMAAGAIGVLVTGYSLWRYRRISAELEQVSAGADLLQRKLAKLRGEHDKNLGQLASQSGENARLKTENAKLRSERDHWQRAAQEARALAAAKQYSVEDLRKALGSDGGKDA
jgi:FtsZ-binding cell division protein ZapB